MFPGFLYTYRGDPDAETHEVAPKAKTRQDVPDEEKAKVEAIAKQKIDEKKVVALTNACANNGVAVEKILRLYKRQSLIDITEQQFMHINTHWEEIKKA